MKSTLIKIVIALVTAVAVVSLVDSYEKKRSPVDKRDSRDKTPTFKQEAAIVSKNISSAISPNVPNEPEIEQTVAQYSPKDMDEVLQDVETTKIEEKTLELAEILRDMREISAAAVDTGEALLSIDFGKEAQSSAEVKNEKEDKHGNR